MTERTLEELVASLVAVDSTNPVLVPGGAGEAAVAGVVLAWMRDHGLDVSMRDVQPGRPMVVGVARGRGGGPSLLLTGHLDTVGPGGMIDPFEPRITDGRLTGRGTYDMKGGLAAAMLAAAAVEGLRGDVIVAAVPDEEAGGTGTRALLEDGWRPDAAVVTEPTDLAVGIAHKGFIGFEVETTGRAAHGSRPDLGGDAIMRMGRVLVELEAVDRRLQASPPHPVLGASSLHASSVEGGEELSTYPRSCVVRGECRTVPGDEVITQLKEAMSRSGVNPRLEVMFTGAPFEVDPTAQIVDLMRIHSGGTLTGLPFWSDAALLAAAEIPTVVFGPSGGGAHAHDEWLDLASVSRVRDVLVATANAYCR